MPVATATPQETGLLMTAEDLWQLGCGVTAVWLIDPQTHRVTCCHAPAERRVFGTDDVLSQPDVLPDFALPVRELFD